MKRGFVILVWLVSVVLATGFVLPTLSPPMRTHGHQSSLYFSVENQTIRIYSQRTLFGLDEETLQSIYCFDIVDTQGPWGGFIEFYETTGCLDSASSIYPYGIGRMLTNEQREAAYLQAIEYAKNDPKFILYNPGAELETAFLPMSLMVSLVKVLAYFGFPVLIAAIANFFWKDKVRAIQLGRQATGLCPHCTYDCTDLTTTICPECGKPYMVPNS